MSDNKKFNSLEETIEYLIEKRKTEPGLGGLVLCFKNYQEEHERLQKENSDLKAQTKRWAVQILKVRDALAINDYKEACSEGYHELYKIASPDFDKISDEVWKDIETIAQN